MALAYFQVPLEILPQIIFIEDTWLSWCAPLVIKDSQWEAAWVWVMVDQVWIYWWDVHMRTIEV